MRFRSSGWGGLCLWVQWVVHRCVGVASGHTSRIEAPSGIHIEFISPAPWYITKMSACDIDRTDERTGGHRNGAEESPRWLELNARAEAREGTDAAAHAM